MPAPIRQPGRLKVVFIRAPDRLATDDHRHYLPLGADLLEPSAAIRIGNPTGLVLEAQVNSTERSKRTIDSVETMAKKLPKQLAILDEDLCTGCEACMTVCPVDCIDKVSDPGHPGYAMGICSIDIQVCIGCKLCAQVCPWNVITMVPTDQVMAQEKFYGLVSEEQLAALSK